MDNQWLLLTDYSSKYRISVSTLRRRIKNHSIPFHFESGKYFIYDAPPSHPEMTAPAKNTPMFPELRTFSVESATLHRDVGERLRNFYPDMPKVKSSPTPRAELETPRAPQLEEPVISTATRLLDELKKAYMSILHEKEEQILQLKEEVSDLKTLVRVLEEDNDRMRSFLQPFAQYHPQS